MIATLKDSLDTLCKESSFRILLDPFLSIKASFLVGKEGVPAFCRTVKCQISTYPDLRFVLTGPWPPYNFVSICDEPVDRFLLQ